MALRGVTFDYGQTLASLDPGLLAARLAERGLAAEAADIEDALQGAFAAYDAAVRRGLGGHPWRLFMRELLLRSGLIASEALDELVEWLWSEQPTRNLWRRPIPGMLELVADLRREGVGCAVVSNSEGHLAALAEEMGIGSLFAAIADSGALGVEKPDPRIFRWAAARLGLAAAELVHVGDSLAADVEGALGAGLSAIWFGGQRGYSQTGVTVCSDAREVRLALQAAGLLPR